MKNNKMNIGLVAGLAAVVLLILLLTMCTGPKEETPPATLPVERVAESTAATEQATTAPTEATTAPTEETTQPTEPTEETTEPTEEATEPTTSGSGSGGSSKPGGSGGYDPGGDYDDGSDDKKEDKLEIPAAGTQKNPYVEVVPEYPGSVTSVSIPSGGKISYWITGSAGAEITIEDPDAALIYNGTTYTADETGVLRVDMSEATADAVIQLSNAGKEAKSYLLQLNKPLGSVWNPVILTDISRIDVKLKADDADGCYYRWTAPGTGTLTLTTAANTASADVLSESSADSNTEPLATPIETIISEDPETVVVETEITLSEDTEIAAVMTKHNTAAAMQTADAEPAAEEKGSFEVIVTAGERTFKLSESEDGTITLDLNKSDVVQIQVAAIPDETGKYPAITETITGKFEIWPGTEENPYEHTLSAIPGSFTTVEIPADTHVYYHIYGAGGSFLKIADKDAYIMYGNTTTNPVSHVELAAVEDGQPVILAVGNSGKESKSFMLEFGYEGTAAFPELLTSIDSVSLILTEGTTEGYYYQWKAKMDGIVTVALESIVPDTTGCEVTMTEENGESCKLSESENGTLTAALSEGETIVLHIAVLPDENGTYPIAQIQLKGTFEPAPGTRDNPIEIAEVPADITVSVAAEKTVFLKGLFYGQVLTVENGANATVIWNEDTYSADESGKIQVTFPEDAGEEPEAITIAITGTVAGDYVLTFDYPLGSEKNPAVLALGENTASLEENDQDGYIFQWAADCDGALTIAMDETSHWQYALSNVTAGVNGNVHTSGDETIVSSETLAVSAGDVIRLVVHTYDPADTASNPAGTVTFTATFFDPLLGTSEKPIRLDPNELTEITIPAGEYRYFTADAEEMILTVEGKYVIVSTGGDNYNLENGKVSLPYQSVFSLTNVAEGDDLCTIRFAYPKGHRKNPDILTVGTNKAKLEAGNKNGHSYIWTALVDGELTITMPADAQWQYTIGEESYNSAQEPVVTVKTLTVTAGEEIRITVNTFDPEHPDTAPAGEVVFTASFYDPTLGTEANPITLGMSGSITIPAGKTMYYTAKADGMVMTLKSEQVTVKHNGIDYTPANGVLEIACAGASILEPPVFAITNHAQTDTTCTFHFAYPLGHMENPVTLQMGENRITLKAGDEDGCFFLWKAAADGKLTITMSPDAAWQYVVNNLTTAVNGDLHTSDEETPVLSETITVSKGDEIQLIVNTYDPANPFSPPGGELMFTVSFVAPEPEIPAV